VLPVPLRPGPPVSVGASFGWILPMAHWCSENSGGRGDVSAPLRYPGLFSTSVSTAYQNLDSSTHLVMSGRRRKGRG
jgi:hypothetical protein